MKQAINESSSNEEMKEKYWLVRILYLRCLGFVYTAAFFAAWIQNESLIGEKGLTPAINYIQLIRNQYPSDSNMNLMMKHPMIFWFIEPSTENINSCSFVGLILSMSLMILGSSNMIILFLLWMLYFSIINIGQNWYSFGWESQLLETGFLSIFLVPIISLKKFPLLTPSSNLIIWLLRWFLFKIMIGNGLIKIRGDQCWHDLTCMLYHYQTQPIPNPLSIYYHHNFNLFHHFETLSNHIIEIFLPIFLLWPLRIPRIIFGGIIQILFQIILITSGNLAFLNWLTILPALTCFDDYSIYWMFIKKDQQLSIKVQNDYEEVKKKNKLISWTFWSLTIRWIILLSFTVWVIYLNIPAVKNILSPRQQMNVTFDPFRLSNSYGNFGGITKVRNEVILQGTTDTELNEHTKWVDFEFRCKPGDINRVPCIISPYHLRIDWLMWFAAFQNYQQCPWLVHLVYKLLQGDATADALLAPEGGNPFAVKKQVPTFVRAELYEYRYVNVWTSEEASEEEGWEVGRYWKRKYVRSYLPALDKHNPSVQQFLTAHGMLR